MSTPAELAEGLRALASRGAGDELAAIERTMREDPRSYWQSEAMQARYRELLDGQEPEAAPVEPDDGLPAMMTPREAAAAGIDDYDAYERTMRAVGDVLAPLPNDDARRAVRDGFERLPDVVQSAALAALERRGNAARASDSEVDAFAAGSPAGRALVRAWGSDAGWRLGQVRERLEGVYAALSLDDGEAFDRWWYGLDDTAATAVVRRLAG